MRRTLFDDEHDLFRDSVRRFIAAELAPRNDAWERAGIVDRDMFQSAGKHGFLGMAVPMEYGGGGVDDFRYNLVIGEEVQRAGINAGLGAPTGAYAIKPSTASSHGRIVAWMSTRDASKVLDSVTDEHAGDIVRPARVGRRQDEHLHPRCARPKTTGSAAASVAKT